MPNPSLQDAIKEAYAVAPANKTIIDTLEIRQVGVQDTIWIAKAKREFIANDENSVERTFEPVGFQFTLPAQNEEGFRSLNIAIDNVGRRLSAFIEAAKSEKVPVEVLYRPYLSDDPSGPQMNPPLLLFLKDISVSTHQVVGRATFMDIVNKRFPTEYYLRSRFPSLG